MKHKNQILNIK